MTLMMQLVQRTGIYVVEDREICSYDLRDVKRHLREESEL